MITYLEYSNNISSIYCAGNPFAIIGIIHEGVPPLRAIAGDLIKERNIAISNLNLDLIEYLEESSNYLVCSNCRIEKMSIWKMEYIQSQSTYKAIFLDITCLTCSSKQSEISSSLLKKALILEPIFIYY